MLMPQAMVPTGRKCPDKRSVTAPSTRAMAAVTASPANTVSHGLQPAWVVSTAVVYAPTPTNAAWPNDVMPPTPVIRLQPSATRVARPM